MAKWVNGETCEKHNEEKKTKACCSWYPPQNQEIIIGLYILQSQNILWLSWVNGFYFHCVYTLMVKRIIQLHFYNLLRKKIDMNNFLNTNSTQKTYNLTIRLVASLTWVVHDSAVIVTNDCFLSRISSTELLRFVSRLIQEFHSM